MDTHHLTPDITDAADQAPSDPHAGRTGACAQQDGGQWRLDMLKELAEIGMEVARAFGRQVVEAVQATEPGAVPSEEAIKAEAAFKSAGRTVRQTLALHAKLEKQAREADRKAAEKEESEAEDADVEYAEGMSLRRIARRNRRKATVKRAVELAIENDADPDDAEYLLSDLDERLDEYEDYADYAATPISAMVAGICRAMGVVPDWRRYLDQPWAIEEMRTKPPGSPYANWDDWAEADGPPDDPAGDERERGPP